MSHINHKNPAFYIGTTFISYIYIKQTQQFFSRIYAFYLGHTSQVGKCGNYYKQKNHITKYNNIFN